MLLIKVWTEWFNELIRLQKSFILFPWICCKDAARGLPNSLERARKWIVSLAAVLCLVTQRCGEERCVTRQNGCDGDKEMEGETRERRTRAAQLCLVKLRVILAIRVSF